MNRFSLVGLTGMFTSNTFTVLVISVGWIKMSLSSWQKFVFPVPLFCILLTSTITECMLFKSTVEPRLSGLFDHLDLFPWSRFFFMNISKMWSWKIETIKCVFKTLFQCVSLSKSTSGKRWTIIILMHSAEFWLAQYCYVAKGKSCLIPRWLCKHKTYRS